MRDRECTLINIGTNNLVSTFLHLAEEISEVPYKFVSNNRYQGYLLKENFLAEPIEIRNHAYTENVTLNKQKIERFLAQQGVVAVNYINGVKVIKAKSNDMISVLTNKLSVDPYFMVSF